ncbi:MAG: type II toxin-antitoxin system RelE/ParE family toxin [Burkholderiales bacterium]
MPWSGARSSGFPLSRCSPPSKKYRAENAEACRSRSTARRWRKRRLPPCGTRPRAAVKRARRSRRKCGRVVGVVVTQPTLGAPGRYRTRVVPLHKFPYSLIYRIQADTLRVLAIAHQRRRPGYWGKRS